MAVMTNTTQEATRAVHASMARMQELGFGSMSMIGANWAERMAEHWAELGSEMLDFMAERVHEDVAFRHQLFQCRDMGELHKLQADFVQRMIDRYTEEAGRVMEMNARIWQVPGTPDSKG